MTAYTVDRLKDDVLCVADSVGGSQFSVWGYSYGENIARFLPSRTDRVTEMVMIGVSFSAAAPGKFRESALGLKAKWTPVTTAYRAGKLDANSLSDADRVRWQNGNIELAVP